MRNTDILVTVPLGLTVCCNSCNTPTGCFCIAYIAFSHVECTLSRGPNDVLFTRLNVEQKIWVEMSSDRSLLHWGCCNSFITVTGVPIVHASFKWNALSPMVQRCLFLLVEMKNTDILLLHWGCLDSNCCGLLTGCPCVAFKFNAYAPAVLDVYFGGLIEDVGWEHWHVAPPLGLLWHCQLHCSNWMTLYVAVTI